MRRGLRVALLVAVVAPAGGALAGWALRAQTAPPQSVLPTRESREQLLAVADAYLAAYARWDLEALRAHFDEQSVWFDPTSAEIGQVAGPFRGAQGILDGLRAVTAGIPELGFRFEERFVSADLVVAIGRLQYTLPGAMIGPGARDVPFDLRVVTVLRIADGKVREHTDYTDFSRWLETLNAAQQAPSAPR